MRGCHEDCVSADRGVQFPGPPMDILNAELRSPIVTVLFKVPAAADVIEIPSMRHDTRYSLSRVSFVADQAIVCIDIPSRDGHVCWRPDEVLGRKVDKGKRRELIPSDQLVAQIKRRQAWHEIIVMCNSEVIVTLLPDELCRFGIANSRGPEGILRPS